MVAGKSDARVGEALVDDYLLKVPAKEAKIVAYLRNLVKSTLPSLSETIRWGFPSYVGNGDVIFLMVNKGYVNLLFAMGSHLTDKDGLLEGSGKNMRHIKVHNLDEFPKAKAVALMKDALKVDAKAPAKKSEAKKPATKKAVAKKAPAKKSVTKKAPARKSAVKKSAPRRLAAKPATRKR